MLPPSVTPQLSLSKSSSLFLRPFAFPLLEDFAQLLLRLSPVLMPQLYLLELSWCQPQLRLEMVMFTVSDQDFCR